MVFVKRTIDPEHFFSFIIEKVYCSLLVFISQVFLSIKLQGQGANISFPNRSAMARVLSLWRSIEKKGSESETSRQSRV